MDELKAMRTFVAVFEAGNFTRAAHGLRVSVATVSERVNALEASFGTKLFNRTTRALVPTAAGTRVYEANKKIITELDQLRIEINPDTDVLTGHVTVEAPVGMLKHIILPCVQQFHERHPGITLDIVSTRNPFWFTRSATDITIAYSGPFAEKRRGSLSLGRSRSAFVASPQYIARHGAPDGPFDLQGHHCIGFMDPTTKRHWEWFFRDGDEIRSLEIAPWIATSHGEFIPELVSAGLGIANVMELLVAEKLVSGELVSLMDRWTCEVEVGTITFDKAGPQSAAVEAFIAHITQFTDHRADLSMAADGYRAIDLLSRAGPTAR